MLKNLSTSIILIVMIGAVIIMSASATASPAEESDQIAETKGGIIVASLDTQNIVTDNLLKNAKIDISARPHESIKKVKPNQNKASFPDMPIIVLLGIGLFSIATIRRRSFLR